MDGLILFVSSRHIAAFEADFPSPQAALFSAVVTAFIIESYRTLSRDSNDVVILLLFQMSEQLAAMSNKHAGSPNHQILRRTAVLLSTQERRLHQRFLVSQSWTEPRMCPHSNTHPAMGV
jgi:hypothetical protein